MVTVFRPSSAPRLVSWRYCPWCRVVRLAGQRTETRGDGGTTRDAYGARSMALHLSSEVRERSSAAFKKDSHSNRRSLKGGGGGGGGGGDSGGVHGGRSIASGSGGAARMLQDAFAMTSDVDIEAGESVGATAGGGVTLNDLRALSSKYPGVEGAGLEVARAVAEAAAPGQVVLTTPAWSHMQGRAPAGAYPLSLGIHAVTAADVAQGRSQELFELVSSSAPCLCLA